MDVDVDVEGAVCSSEAQWFVERFGVCQTEEVERRRECVCVRERECVCVGARKSEEKK